MYLPDEQVARVVEEARCAFPELGDWEWVNEPDYEHDGFTLWGRFVIEDDPLSPRRFFVTLELRQAGWRAFVSIGMHMYMWTSADFGDASLLLTRACPTPSEAILALKVEIRRLFSALGPS